MNPTKTKHTPNAISRKVDLELQLLARARKPTLKKPSSKPKELALHLGTDQLTGKDILVPQKMLYENNMHLAGQSRTGKSFLMLYIVNQLLDWPNTSVVMPVPDGDLGSQCRDLVLAKGMADRLIWIDAMDYYRGVSVGLDFLRRDHRAISVQAKSIREAIIYGHGQAEGMDQTKQMARILYTVLYAALSANLTIVEAKRVLTDQKFRLQVRERVTNAEVLQELFSWDDGTIPPYQLAQLLAPSVARLSEVVDDEITSAMIGQKLNSIDIPDAMAHGKIIIINTPQNRPLKVDTMRTLLRTFNNLVIDGVGQIAGSGMHVHYILDEGYFVTTEDTARSWDTLLKAGLQTIFAHHYLLQVEQHGGPIVKESLLNNGGGIRCIFRLNNVADSKFWAEQIFHQQYNPLKKKYSRMDKRFEPVLKQQLVKTYTRGGSHQWNTSKTIMHGNAANRSHTHTKGESDADIAVDSITDISGSGSAKNKFGSGGASIGMGMSEYDGEESPVITYNEVESSSGGSGTSENDFNATAMASSRGKVKARSASDADTLGTQQSVQHGTTSTDGGSSNWSESESIQQYVDYIAYYEEVDVQHYSEQEQIAMGSQVINGFANRHCVVQLPGGVVMLNKTPDMEDVQMTDGEREQKMLPFYRSLGKLEDIEHEIAVRQAPFQEKSKGGKKGQVI